MIGLRLLLKDGLFMNVIVSQKELDDILELWEISSQRVLKNISTSDGIQWRVRVGDIVALHTFPLEQKPIPHSMHAGHSILSGPSYRVG